MERRWREHEGYLTRQAVRFTLSRSELDLYLNCPRCFYLDRRLGIGRPSAPPFTLNSAVDQFLKTEFCAAASGTIAELRDMWGNSALAPSRARHDKLALLALTAGVICKYGPLTLALLRARGTLANSWRGPTCADRTLA